MEINRRGFLKKVALGLLGIEGARRFAGVDSDLIQIAEAAGLRFADGKIETFPRSVAVDLDGDETTVLHKIDWSPLGPDTDSMIGIDLLGNIQTGAQVIYEPEPEELIKETRVVALLRNNLSVVQFQPALGGDMFHMYKVNRYGGDRFLDRTGYNHGRDTSRLHQKVVYIGDLGLFEEQWGEGEQELLNTIIRAQLPARPDLGIPEPNFAFPRS